MQFTLVSVSFLAALAAAQNSTTTDLPSLVSQLPKCALTCFQRGASDAKCSTTDFKCLCDSSKRQQFTTSVGLCLFAGTGGCSSDDTNKLTTLAGQICGEVANNPTSSEIAKASSLVTAALGTAAPTATSTSTNGAPAPTLGGIGLLGAAAIAAMAL